LRSAQRLSASSEFALAIYGTGRDETSVLNAFRHHRNSHNTLRCVFGGDSLCSTPFGIIGIRTCPDWARAVTEKMCSTPFGIIGIRTRHMSLSITSITGAQRLSASSEFARPAPSSLFSIKSVLNAFRHHRNSHYLNCRCRTCGYCAQRLSASSEFAPWQGRKYCERRSNVLNAFRHHRNSHPEIPGAELAKL